MKRITIDFQVDREIIFITPSIAICRDAKSIGFGFLCFVISIDFSK